VFLLADSSDEEHLKSEVKINGGDVLQQAFPRISQNAYGGGRLTTVSITFSNESKGEVIIWLKGRRTTNVIFL
jgi:hypothetical protein